MSIHRWVPLAALGLVALVSCAPSERSMDPSPAELPFQAGSLSGSTAGRVGAAQTTSSAGVTLTGLTGNFTRLSYQPSSSGTSAPAVYFTAVSENSVLHLWKVNTDGTGLEELTHDTTERTNPSVAPSGNRVLFWQLEAREPVIARTWLAELLPDNSVRQLLLETNGFTPPVWTPDENAVIYSQTIFDRNRTARILRVNLETLVKETLYQDSVGNIVDETLGALDGRPVVIFQDTDIFYRLDLDPSARSTYLASTDPSVGFAHPRFSPDGTRIMYWAGPSSTLHHPAAAELRIGDAAHPESTHPILTLQNQGYPAPYDARWLVDGSGIVALIPQETTGVAQLYLLDTLGTVIRQLTSQPLGVSRGFSVGPARATGAITLIGEDGILGTSACGIIFGQGVSGTITSVVSFLSSRPRSVELKAETGLNSSAPVLTYTLRADRLEGLRFVTNPGSDSAVTVIDSTMPPVGGAVITFDAVTGKVGLILPFAAGARAPESIAKAPVN